MKKKGFTHDVAQLMEDEKYKILLAGSINTKITCLQYYETSSLLSVLIHVVRVFEPQYNIFFKK